MCMKTQIANKVEWLCRSVFLTLSPAKHFMVVFKHIVVNH